uniref:Olfactory receptor n=1 Tax=Catagonus wagneri TaxID=51154 RepID=A0A8C3WFU8_9CETA
INNTHVSEFILTGLTDSEATQRILFMLFLLIYLMTVLGNAVMMLIIRLDLQLHTPMYFFLSHLSFLDLSYSNVITPKTLGNLLTSTRYISYMNCFTQIYFFVFLAGTECFLLSSMAFDRCAAIRSPLRYPIVMSTRSCCSLVFGSYLIGFVDSFFTVLCMSRLDFCDSNVIHHFFCDISPILALSCSDIQSTEIIIFILAVLVSYIFILATILRMNSAKSRLKAFSTCGSHLTVIVIFYGTLFFMYVQPKSSDSFDTDKMASLFYTLVIPMLNPMIYSLRNKEVKNALTRTSSIAYGSSQGRG